MESGEWSLGHRWSLSNHYGNVAKSSSTIRWKDVTIITDKSLHMYLESTWYRNTRLSRQINQFIAEARKYLGQIQNLTMWFFLWVAFTSILISWKQSVSTCQMLGWLTCGQNLETMLDGKACYRAVRSHMLTNEALWHIKWSIFKPYLIKIDHFGDCKVFQKCGWYMFK